MPEIIKTGTAFWETVAPGARLSGPVVLRVALWCPVCWASLLPGTPACRVTESLDAVWTLEEYVHWKCVPAVRRTRDGARQEEMPCPQ